MVKKVKAAQAKAHLSALMAQAAYGGMRILIERRGKPLAALVSVDDLERLELGRPRAERPSDTVRSRLLTTTIGPWYAQAKD